jgi:hypothetical protein
MLKGLIGLFTASVGVGIGWAGYALHDPVRAGLKALPPQVVWLPFDRGFWSLALMLLGAATVLKALPQPFWTK